MLLITLFIAGISLVTKLYNLGAHSLDFDEIYSVFSSDSSLAFLLMGIRYDPGNPPLYFMLLKAWRVFTGNSELAVRLLSVLLHLTTIGAIYWQCRKKLSPAATVSILLLFTGSATIYQLARYARAYTLIILLVVTLYPLLVKYVEDEKSSWFNQGLLFFLATAGLYTHYSFVIFYATLTLVLVAHNLRDRERLWKLLLFSGFVFVAYWPWAFFFVQNQLAPAIEWYKYNFYQLTSSWIGITGWIDVFTNQLFTNIVPRYWQNGVGILIILLTDLLFLRLYLINRHNLWKKYLLSFFLVASSLLFFTPLHRVITQAKYAAYLLPFGFMAVGIAIDHLPRSVFQTAVAVILVVYSFFTFPTYFNPAATEDWKNLSQVVQLTSKGMIDKAILFHPCFYGFSFTYYFSGRLPMYCLYKNPEKMYLDIWDKSLYDNVFIVHEKDSTDSEAGQIIQELGRLYSQQRQSFGAIELIEFRKIESDKLTPPPDDTVRPRLHEAE